MDQQVTRRRSGPGLTLVEMAIGIAVLGAMGLVTVGLFKSGIITYHYTMHQLLSLTHSRQALGGDGDLHGLFWETQESRFVTDLSSSSLNLSPASGSTLRYYVSGSILYQSQVGEPVKQAEGVRGLEVKYYNLDEDGRIVESAEARSAALVALYLKTPGCRGQDCLYFTGAALRNHP